MARRNNAGARAARQAHANAAELRSFKAGKDDRSETEKRAEWLMDRQIDVPLYVLLALIVAHALSGTSSLSLPHLSNHLPFSLQHLLPGWARSLPILAPFATELPNASHDSKHYDGSGSWSTLTTGFAGPFRSDAVGFGHPLTALHNFTRACLGLSYAVREKSGSLLGSSILTDDLTYGQSSPYFDRYPWNSWTRQADDSLNFWAKKYEKGAKDIFFVMTGVLVFTILRALVVRHLLNPLARVAVPAVRRTKDRMMQAKLIRQRRRMCARFAEQAWVAIWGTFSFASSMLVASQEPYWNNEKALWASWPYTQLSGLTKLYYLMQTAFWVQQVIVLHVEDRRKDHYQMLSHHIVTIMLLLGSYASHFTPVGNVVLILMDPCDILLSAAKCIRYAGLQTACDICFGLFVLTWIVTRHVLYGRALYSCIGVGRYHIPDMPGATFKEYWGFRTFMAFILVVLLSVLQVILCVWLVMILRVVWKVVTGHGASDTRSDDESDEEDGKEEMEQQQQQQQRKTHDAQRSTAISTAVTPSSQIDKRKA